MRWRRSVGTWTWILAVVCLGLVVLPVTPAGASTGGRKRAPRGKAVQSAATVEALFDSSGWDWRGQGIGLRIGYHRKACCHWGIFDSRQATVWIGPSAFATPARLRYVALHELAHAWQLRSGHVGQLFTDLVPWGQSGVRAIEAGADCIAGRWGAGAGTGHYWSCPAPASALVGRRLAGDWTT